jgi:hypothetical protein
VRGRQLAIEAFEIDTLTAYAGLDVAAPLMSFNAKRFEHHSNKVFAPWDFVVCPLPKFQLRGQDTAVPFQLVHVRDVIQHLALDHGMLAVHNALTSGCTLLISTTNPGKTNRNIKDGDFFENDMHAPPFGAMFEPPIRCGDEHADGMAGKVCLYRCNKTRAEAAYGAYLRNKGQA